MAYIHTHSAACLRIHNDIYLLIAYGRQPYVYKEYNSIRESIR